MVGPCLPHQSVLETLRIYLFFIQHRLTWELPTEAMRGSYIKQATRQRVALMKQTNLLYRKIS